MSNKFRFNFSLLLFTYRQPFSSSPTTRLHTTLDGYSFDHKSVDVHFSDTSRISNWVFYYDIIFMLSY